MATVTPPENLSEYQVLTNSADTLREQLREARKDVGVRCRKLRRHRKLWQTAVVLSAALSTGLAGYMVQAKDRPDLGIALAIFVALAGAVAAIRDAWQVNESLDDASSRYAEIAKVTSELEKARYAAEGCKREEDRLAALGPTVRYTQTRLEEITDDLVSLSGQKATPQS